MLWLVAASFLTLAIFLSPERVDPYLPAKAAGLIGFLHTGVQLTRLLLFAGTLLAVITEGLRQRVALGGDFKAGSSWARWDWLIAALITLAALAIRLPNAAESLWDDELNSQVRVVQRGLGVIFAFSADGNNHLANSLLMWLASMFSTEDWMLRLPSLLIGTLLPAGVYLSFQRIGLRGVALLAALFIVFHFRTVSYSNEARGYIGAIAFGAAASVAFSALCRSWKRRWAVVYIIAAVLASSFLIAGIFSIVAHSVIAGGLLIYRLRNAATVSRLQPGGEPAWHLPLWCFVMCCWALLLSLLVSALTLPQLADYSRNRAGLAHTITGLQSYLDTLPFLTGVEHHAAALILLAAALAGYWLQRCDWVTSAAMVGPALVQAAYFQLSGSLASPRLFVPFIFPILIGLSLFISHLWRRNSLLRRTLALIPVVLLLADSLPLYGRYYGTGNPKLRELAARLPPGETFLANAQADMNGYYFEGAPWQLEEPKAVEQISTMQPAPKFVLSGEDCRRANSQGIQNLGYRPILKLNDWTWGEHSKSQRRPCFILYERGAREPH